MFKKKQQINRFFCVKRSSETPTPLTDPAIVVTYTGSHHNMTRASCCTALVSTFTLLCTSNGFLQWSTFTRGGAAVSSPTGRALTSGGYCLLGSASSDGRSRLPATGAKGAEAVCMSAGAAKKIVVLGGDGFCGWPTCLHLSDAGYVSVVGWWLFTFFFCLVVVAKIVRDEM